MIKLWNKIEEKGFFDNYLKITDPKNLFYVTKDKKYLAYWPKNYDGKKTTLQSRNALIGSYTEKWATALFSDIAKMVDGYAVKSVISGEIGLTRQSPADIAICKTNDVFQKPENILMIIEIKMSIVWNWEFISETSSLVCIGDYKTHQGNPGLLRSDTMLKAIGKSINIRVSGISASKIPIIVVGNTPITKSYYEKVDHLKISGIIQGFWSVNPEPLDDDKENIKSTPFKGFYRFDNYEELSQNTIGLLKEEREYFSSMQSREKIGRIIEIANKECTYEEKAQKFLMLLRQTQE